MPASAPRGKAKGKILAFIGAKGGVGTTTVALNVSAGIAQLKRNVILAELRGSCGTVSHHFQRQVPPGNLSRLVNQSPALINELELNACMAKYSTGYRVLFGPQKADEAKPVPGDTARAVTHLLGSMAEFVVVDLPPDPSDSNRNAIRECDFVGLVLEREPSCLASARIMLDHINSWTTDALVALVVVHRTPLAVPLDLDQVVNGPRPWHCRPDSPGPGRLYPCPEGGHARCHHLRRHPRRR